MAGYAVGGERLLPGAPGRQAAPHGEADLSPSGKKTRGTTLLAGACFGDAQPALGLRDGAKELPQGDGGRPKRLKGMERVGLRRGQHRRTERAGLRRRSPLPRPGSNCRHGAVVRPVATATGREVLVPGAAAEREQWREQGKKEKAKQSNGKEASQQLYDAVEPDARARCTNKIAGARPRPASTPAGPVRGGRRGDFRRCLVRDARRGAASPHGPTQEGVRTPPMPFL